MVLVLEVGGEARRYDSRALAAGLPDSTRLLVPVSILKGLLELFAWKLVF